MAEDKLYKGKENTYRIIQQNAWIIQKLVGSEWKDEYYEGYFNSEKEAEELVKELIEIEG